MPSPADPVKIVLYIGFLRNKLDEIPSSRINYKLILNCLLVLGFENNWARNFGIIEWSLTIFPQRMYFEMF